MGLNHYCICRIVFLTDVDETVIFKHWRNGIYDFLGYCHLETVMVLAWCSNYEKSDTRPHFDQSRISISIRINYIHPFGFKYRCSSNKLRSIARRPITLTLLPQTGTVVVAIPLLQSHSFWGFPTLYKMNMANVASAEDEFVRLEHCHGLYSYLCLLVRTYFRYALSL